MCALHKTACAHAPTVVVPSGRHFPNTTNTPPQPQPRQRERVPAPLADADRNAVPARELPPALGASFLPVFQVIYWECKY